MNLALAIETSCDETAVAVVRSDKCILAQRLWTQDVHRPYGGVVPELAARQHGDILPLLLRDVMAESGVSYQDLNLIAATIGPGLIGGLLVGSQLAKGIAWQLKKPFIGVHHLEAHALSPRAVADCPFPYLLLLVSGGHCQQVLVRGVADYTILGRTVDDSPGEVFDKVARLLHAEPMNGAGIARLASMAVDRDSASAPVFPRPFFGKSHGDFSFSGLKTAVAQYVAGVAHDGIDDAHRYRIAAAFEDAVADCLVDRLHVGISLARTYVPDLSLVAMAGGVASNTLIRRRVSTMIAQLGLDFIVPPPALCTDNAVMVGWAALERFFLCLTDSLDVPERPRWSLESLSRDLP